VATPAERKGKSEATLRSLGLPLNSSLPLTESEKETKLRTKEELLQRLVALWAVAGTAHLPDNDFFRTCLVESNLTGWLSLRERSFLLTDERNERERIHFSWQVESLYFLGWCGGLISKLDIPTQASSVGGLMDLFPQEGDDLKKLRSAISLRSVSEVLDWSDLLYRLHWAMRQENTDGTVPSHAVIPGAVQEWHRAVNWMTRYDDLDDWDHVGTDT
jgi:hypothetical protein